jgi:polysaccharide biosynthesis protein PslG
MRRFAFLLFLAIFLQQFIIHQAAAQEENGLRAVSPNLFSMSAHAGIVSQQPWPVDSFASLRVLQDYTSWLGMNPAQGKYDFSVLDAFMSNAQAHGQSILLVFSQVPQWASSKPWDNTCRGPVGSCDPPSDLNADGSGTNQHWKDFVTTVVTHSVHNGQGHISAYELWNEAYNLWYWTGTDAQLVRMAADAYKIIKSIDPNATISSPSFCFSTTGITWMGNYFAAGGGQYADQIDVHGYVFNRGGSLGWPENLTLAMPPFLQMLGQYGQGAKPIWDTESDWGADRPNRHLKDPDLQAAWLARMYLLHASCQISRFYWFSWNDTGLGTLWIPNPNDPGAPGTLLEPGVAYQQVYNWMVGATMNPACSVNGTIWTCGFTRSNGYVAQAVWDTSQTCSKSICTTVNYAVDPQFIKYLTVTGGTVTVKGTTVPIGAKPILLVNQ